MVAFPAEIRPSFDRIANSCKGRGLHITFSPSCRFPYLPDSLQGAKKLKYGRVVVVVLIFSTFGTFAVLIVAVGSRRRSGTYFLLIF